MFIAPFLLFVLTTFISFKCFYKSQHLIGAYWDVDVDGKCRFFHTESSSEIFGARVCRPQCQTAKTLDCCRNNQTDEEKKKNK